MVYMEPAVMSSAGCLEPENQPDVAQLMPKPECLATEFPPSFQSSDLDGLSIRMDAALKKRDGWKHTQRMLDGRGWVDRVNPECRQLHLEKEDIDIFFFIVEILQEALGSALAHHIDPGA